MDDARPDASASPAVHPATPIAGGLVAGLTAGLFGVGGGVLLVPVLTLLLHRAQHVAHATSLVAVTLAAAAGVTRFGIDGAVSLAGGAALAVGAITGARLGAAFLPKLSDSGLRRLFGGVLVVLAIRFLIAPGSAEPGVADVVPDLNAVVITLHVVGGLLAGITSSVLGVGGGVIMVPLLVIGFGYGQHIAEGTSLAVIVPTALTGAVSHARNGYTDWRLGLQLGLSALIGSLVGASVALSLSPAVLGRGFGLLQLVLGLLMLRGRRGRPTEDGDAPAS